MFTTLIKRFTSNLFNFNFLIFNLSFLIFFSCNSSTDPPPNSEPDTTTHNFTWRIDTLGKYPSYFSDVAVIDENNICAVGEIYTDSGTFNAARWDGYKWSLQDIDLKQPVFSCISFANDNIWATSGIPHYWNGTKWTKYHLWNMNVLDQSDGILISLWGKSSYALYFAGYEGTIVKYDGNSFQKMNSGTDIKLRRISGNEKDNVFITGYNDDGRSIALELENGTWKEKYYYSGAPDISKGNYGRFLSVWCGQDNVYFITVAGLLKVNLRTNKEYLTQDSGLGIYPFAEHDIEGQTENDIIIVSNRSKIVHWNGKTWSIQDEIYNQYPDHILTVYGADYNKETVAVVGTYYSGSQAFIVIGKHIN